MRTRLLHRDRDLHDPPPAPPRAEELRRNLGVDRLLAVMAGGDDTLYRVAEAVLLGDVASAEDIRYRHDVLRDCLAHPEAVDDLRRIAADTVERERHNYFGLFTRATPDKVLYRSLDVLDMFVDAFAELRAACDRWRGGFTSAGFEAFFACVAAELDDEYLATVRAHLKELRFAKGELISMRLGAGAHGAGHVLRRPDRTGWRRLRGGAGGIDLDLDDPAAAEALTTLAGRGIRTAADAVAQAAEHVAAYFRTVADELGFYRAVMNLLAALDERGAAWCLPEPSTRGLVCHGIYHPVLALDTRETLVGNDIDAGDATVTMITGANHGGKTTLLRSLGTAQLMARCGMPVAARDYRGPIHPQVYTHFGGEERDGGDTAGRLEEELSRMSAIADVIRPGALLLCNESLASTNEREGAALAREIVETMRDCGITVVYVTHMYELARGLADADDSRHTFLRAERLDSGDRTFRMLPGPPLPTSHGDDLFRRIFGTPTVR
ncbi:MutS-related protein [Tsukamurella paurometabola]|uniref:DNA mismatch repair protein n=1 Tax=Tsukamurella paurometabola TaxID=2061 RepID=A0ABS5N706_TSUPA|nr:DNA mismatch repair protein [Tsukamurella paurometabola]MBS4100064.1 DNA mismatch repair protein [Tsukamurella paurometabola]